MVASNLIMSPHLRLTWGGEIGDPGVEQWTNGLHLVDLGDGDLPDDEQLQAGLNDIADDISSWFTSPDMRIGDAARLTWAKLNVLDEYGHQPGNTIRHDFPAAVWGSFNGNPDWNQTFAITFRTAKQRGRAHSGRIFPPLVGYNPIGKTPYIDALAATIMASRTGKLLQDLTSHVNDTMTGVSVPPGSGDFEFVPTVVSPGLRDKGTQEVREQILAVTVDRTPDTQHRRTAQVARAEGTPFPIPYA